jgi:ribose transport system ATP-binding protein
VDEFILSAREICKSFGGTRALESVSIALRPGEIHGLVGENGAGKSTLMNIISGALQPDSGVLSIGGETVRIEDPRHATALGISIVHQHSAVVPSLTMAENIFLGRTPQGRLGLVDWRTLIREAQTVVEKLGFDGDVRLKVNELGAVGRQLTEIARALSIDARIVIMDEPSAVLGPTELRKLFQAIAALKNAGKTVLYISHRLNEIFEVADRVTVLKDGRLVGTYDVRSGIDRNFLISRMVGREWNEQFPSRAATLGPELLRVENLSRRGVFDDISFTLHAGEIVGFAGLVGSGRSEVCRAIFGADKYDSGQITVSGSLCQISEPADALAGGIAYVSEDRHREGVVLCLSVAANLTLPILRRFRLGGVLRLRSEAEFAERLMRKVGVRARGRNQIVATLSGGNQQKVSVGKWLATQARVFLLDEPTIGIDVGAKREIYEIIAELTQSNAAVLMVSSEIPEILSMSDRVLVMRKGRITGELVTASATEEEVMHYAAA